MRAPQDDGISARRTIAIAAGITAGAAIGVGAAAAAVAASVARAAVRIDRFTERPISVLRVTGGDAPAVWLEGEGANAPGNYSLVFDSVGDTPGEHPVEDMGHARIGRVIVDQGKRVARELVSIERGTLAPGAAGYLTGWWYTDPRELGLRVEEITYESELGPVSAWVIRPKFARKKRWAIHVHGRGAHPAETLRGVIPLAEAGVTSLVIRYRNDATAPAGVHGRYGLGLAEARDVDAAVAEAIARGAERVTLVGWSMGGTACLVAATRGEHWKWIDGLILDSPAVDWPGVIRSNARARHVPEPLSDVAVALLRHGVVASGVPAGIELTDVTPEAFARNLQVPVLIQASDADRLVPWAGAATLHALRPDLVQLRRVTTAGHVRLWNVDPEGWESAVHTFAAALPRPAWRGQE